MNKSFEEDPDSYLNVAIQAARQAGKVLYGALDKKDKQIEFKGENDVVTALDKESEEIIKEILLREFPYIGVLAEEGGESGDASVGRWIIDPLDGTNSFSHGIPHFCVSIALEINGELKVGVVYNPCLDECFTAIKGKGSYLNNKRLTVSSAKELQKSLLATGFPYDKAHREDNNIDNFGNLLLKCQGIRRMGSAALDLCYTAAGRFDGYWELHLKPWDTAAGVLILTEAGGKVSDFKGGTYSIYGSELLTSNGIIHNQMIEVLKKHN